LVNFFTQVPAIKIGNEKMVFKKNGVCPGTVAFEAFEFGVKGIIGYGKVRLNTDGDPGNLIIAAMICVGAICGHYIFPDYTALRHVRVNTCSTLYLFNNP
jgi:hypothetical protein